MNNKDLIKQYVDTGLQLPEQQVKTLPSWAQKTYIRKRLIATKMGRTAFGNQLSDTELRLLDKNTIVEYLDNRLEVSGHLSDYEFLLLSSDKQNSLVTKRVAKGHQLNNEMFKILSNYQKKEYIDLRLRNGSPLSGLMLAYCDEKTVERYLNTRIAIQLGSFAAFQKGRDDKYPDWFEALEFKHKIKTFELMISNILKLKLSFKYISIDDEYYEHIGPIRKSFLTAKINEEGPYISRMLFNDLSEKQKIIYLKAKFKADGDEYIFQWEKPYMKYVNNE